MVKSSLIEISGQDDYGSVFVAAGNRRADDGCPYAIVGFGAALGMRRRRDNKPGDDSYCACALAAAMSASLRTYITAILLDRA